SPKCGQWGERPAGALVVASLSIRSKRAEAPRSRGRASCRRLARDAHTDYTNSADQCNKRAVYRLSRCRSLAFGRPRLGEETRAIGRAMSLRAPMQDKRHEVCPVGMQADQRATTRCALAHEVRICARRCELIDSCTSPVPSPDRLAQSDAASDAWCASRSRTLCKSAATNARSDCFGSHLAIRMLARLFA